MNFLVYNLYACIIVIKMKCKFGLARIIDSKLIFFMNILKYVKKVHSFTTKKATTSHTCAIEYRNYNQKMMGC